MAAKIKTNRSFSFALRGRNIIDVSQKFFSELITRKTLWAHTCL